MSYRTSSLKAVGVIYQLQVQSVPVIGLKHSPWDAMFVGELFPHLVKAAVTETIH